MRVLHVTRDFPPLSKGGISTAVGGLVAAAAAAGHHLWVLSFDAWRPKAHPGGLALPAAEVGGRVRVQRLRAPHHIAEVAAAVAGFAPAVVHVHHAMLWRAALELAPDARRLLSVHVIQAEMNRLRGVSHTLSATAQAEALAEADVVHVPSAPAASLLLRFHPEIAARLRVVPPGVDASGVDASGVEAIGVDAPRAIATPAPSRSRTVVAVGRFDHAKGTADLAAALPQLIAAVPGVSVRIVGGVPDNPRAARRWQRRLEEAGGEHVQCLGWRPPPAVAAELAGAAVGLFPSHAETFGLALLEAMAHGVAAVATDVAGHRALLLGDDLGGRGPVAPAQVRGVLVPTQSPTALAEATAALLARPDRAAAIGQSARQFAQTLAWSVIWPQWQALLRDTAIQSRRGQSSPGQSSMGQS